MCEAVPLCTLPQVHHLSSSTFLLQFWTRKAPVYRVIPKTTGLGKLHEKGLLAGYKGIPGFHPELASM